MVTGVACGLQNRYGAFARPGWVRFPHVPATHRTPRRTWHRGAAGCALWLTLGATALPGQEPRVVPDTTASAAVADTVPPVSPLGALVRSMVLPGWGQLEVGRPERAAFYFATEATFLYMVFKSHAKLNAAREAVPQNEELVAARTGQRENWIVLAGFIAFLSGLDAWVSTHMWDFEPSIGPPADGSPGIALGLKVGVP